MKETQGSIIIKKIALVDELKTSIQLIKLGLKEVQSISGGNDFYHILMLTLANGFERLMKVIICLFLYERDKSFPTNKYTWKNDHDLIFLLNYIIDNCFYTEYVEKIPVAKEDIDYLRKNKQLVAHVKILSNFGKAARYYNLDIIKGGNAATSSPKKEWEKLEEEIVGENPNLKKTWLIDPNLESTYKIINKEIVIRFERFARALSRLFTIGHLGEYAKQISPQVYPFLMLMEEDLGKLEY